MTLIIVGTMAWAALWQASVRAKANPRFNTSKAMARLDPKIVEEPFKLLSSLGRPDGAACTSLEGWPGRRRPRIVLAHEPSSSMTEWSATIIGIPTSFQPFM